MAEPAPSTAQLSCWREASSFQDPPITGSNGNGGATSSGGEFGGARSEGEPQQPAAAAAAAVAAGLAGVAMASAGSAASSPLTGAGGIAEAGGKKVRKKTKPVSAAVLEVRNRRREKIQEKAAQRRSPAVAQPVAEASESLPGNIATAEPGGGGGNTEPTAVAKKKLRKPGRAPDLGVAALHKALWGGGGKRATQGQIRPSSNNAAGLNNGKGSGAQGWVLQKEMRQQERCIRYWNQQQQQQQHPEEGLVQGAGSPEPHAWQEAGGGVKVREYAPEGGGATGGATVRKYTPEEQREENERAEKKQGEKKEKGEENRKEEEAERVIGRPASHMAPSYAADQGTTHAAASSDFEGRCYDEEVAKSKKLLSFEDAESFLAKNLPGVEDVYSMGQSIGISIRGDGNCFWTSCSLAVLLWASCQDRLRHLQDVLARYRAICRGSCCAYYALSLAMKENVDTFVSLVEMLLRLKTTGTSNQDLVGFLVRHLSKPSDGRQEGSLHAPLFKGMVLATRIAATVYKTPSAGPESLDGFATVSEYTNGDMFDQRPGEPLGIRVDLVADYCEPSGEHVTYRCNDGDREQFGYGPVSRLFPLVDSIAVRKGALAHFDLRIKACSSVGTALAGALEIRQLTDEDGLAEHHRHLKLEIVSQVVIHPGGCPRCSMHIPQSAVVCEMCNFPVPDGFVYAPDPGGGVVHPTAEVAEVAPARPSATN
ncbi:unnamed protein product [Ectocarpus sp. 6 AP-2014]